MASLKSFLQFHKDSQPRIIESRMVSLSSIFIAYIFFFRLARSNLVAAWAVCSYVVISILALVFSGWLDYFPMRLTELKLRLVKNSALVVGCMLPPMTLTALLVCTSLRAPRLEAALSFYLLLSVSLSVMSILATLFHSFPSPTNISMYLFTVIGASYGISQLWHHTLANVKPPGPLFINILCASYLFITVVAWLLNAFEGSFTLCEACTIGQGISLSCYDVILQLLNHYGLVRLPAALVVPRTEVTSILQMVIFTVVVVSMVCSTLYNVIQQSRNDPTSYRFWSVTIYLAIVGMAVFLCLPWLEALMERRFFVWFFAYVFDSSKIPLLLYWALVSGFAMLLVVAQSSSSTWLMAFKANNPSSPWFRKWFHLLAILVYVPGLVTDPQFTSLASVVALTVFMFLEFVRCLRLWPFGDTLQVHLNQFTDSKDKGPLVLTHIYLLVGFSLPLWLYPLNSYGKGWPKISLYSGVIALGVGDSLASIVGKSFGKWKIPGTQKTVEGAVASIVGQAVAMVLLSYIDPAVSLYYYSPYDYWCLGGAIVMTSLLEAFTSQIDNLILPIYFFSLLLVSYT